MASQAAQYRNEKKRIEEAVAKVREVVHTASKNDIVLALHNYDLDINRTIQAFCDDGAQSALDSWETSGTAGSKKGHKKKKVASVPLAPSTTVSVPRSPPPSAPMNSGLSDLRNNVAPAPNDVTNNNQLTMSNLNTAASTTAFEAGPTVSPAKPIFPSSTSPRPSPYAFGAVDDKDLTIVLSELKKQGADMEKLEAAFDGELSVAEEKLRSAFKVVRQVLADRESHLLAELKRSYDDYARLLNETRVLAFELYERGQRIAAMSDREQSDLREEIAQFAADRQRAEEMANTTRFLSDNTHLIKLVKNFGEVVGMKAGASSHTATSNGVAASQSNATNPTASMKHSASHSSIVSSVGEDSGFGQISPIASEERKNVVEVSNGGIVMKSDSLSADQLEDLNKKLQETLKAQGIDLSILPNIGGGAPLPARRRPAGSGRGGRGGAGAQARRHAGQPATRVPDLSILQS